MKFPYIVKKDLSKDELNTWSTVYEKHDECRDRTMEEGLWRRTQDERNKDLSGWGSDEDKKRRLIHYYYKYDVSKTEKGGDLVLKDFYLWVFYTLPESQDLFEAIDFENRIKETKWDIALRNNNNMILHQGGLHLHVQKRPSQIQGYFDYDFTFTSDNFNPSDEVKDRPWVILKTGIRKKDRRLGTPKSFSFEMLKDLLPAQVELGCGPSMESGIQPLHYLHDVYSVSEDFKTKKFVLDPDKDAILKGLLFDTESIFPELTAMFRRSFETEPGEFYQYLKKMFEKGYFVGDIINNNFDLLPAKLELTENFVRKFDEQHILPKFEFEPEAKSLFVFGLHADRRKTQAAAREKGLQVVYVDTEGFYIGDVFHEYPLEGTQENDILYKEKAGASIKQMFDHLEQNNK
jgi:hypothetical protein